jgi:hypothetical protein
MNNVDWFDLIGFLVAIGVVAGLFAIYERR